MAYHDVKGVWLPFSPNCVLTMSFKGLRGLLPDASALRRKLYKQIGGKDQTPNAVRRWVRDTIAQPMVWHLNRRSVAGGVAVGLFVSWMPLPMQMLVAAVPMCLSPWSWCGSPIL